MKDNIRDIAVLGSTGSIGTQTLDIIDRFPHKFRASVLTARRNVDMLAQQARKFLPKKVVIADESLYLRLKDLLSDVPVEVEAGDAAIANAAATYDVDTVVTAMVGYSGLIPTVKAIEAGKTIALANKETLVVAGEVINQLLKKHDSRIVPVDSEHSAIFQCLRGESTLQARKIILTASGGPFRTFSKQQLENVTVEDALNHPNWSMGAKVTIDSASMMNKGFEMIEARWLFGCPPDKIEIIVHPQSIVHSMVEFNDGSIKAQLGIPDMHIPISYALGYPERLLSNSSTLQLSQYSSLTFEAPDYDKFPLLSFAFDAINMGGSMPCVLNAANEVAVAAFLNRRLRFTDMPRLVATVMEAAPFVSSPSISDFMEINETARRIAEENLQRFQ